MRTRRVLLLTLAVAASLVVASATKASAQPLPGVGYLWAQPGTSLFGVTSVQPVAPTVVSMLPSGGYVWAQPGSSLVGATTVQPVS